MSKIYEAVPLTSSKTCVRLLKLSMGTLGQEEEGQSNRTISCELYTADLAERPIFRAISYMWGEEVNTKSMLVNDEVLEIRENLWDFLHQCRESQESKQKMETQTPGYSNVLPFWIDSICIDQHLVREKNHQVSIMGDIYSSADHVICWLGKGDEHLYRGIETLEDHSDQLSHMLENHLRDMLPEAGLVYNHPYWRRLWIMQEIILSKNIIFWCGTYTIREKTMFDGGKRFKDIIPAVDDEDPVLKGPYVPFLLLALRRYRNLPPSDVPSSDMSYVASPEGTSALQVALILAEDALCADRRDRIYGILSLLSAAERDRFGIHPDYAKSATDLYIEVVVSLWKNVAKYDASIFEKYFLSIVNALELRGALPMSGTAIQEMYPKPQEDMHGNLPDKWS